MAAPAAWRRVARGLARWLERAAPASARGRVVIAIVSDRAMRRLNRQFRHIDAPTDVLSFPAERMAARRQPRGPARSRLRSKSLCSNELGEIAIAGALARRQAARYGHPVGVELRVLALHGLLHLLGYDHERDQGQMQRLEARLRRRMNLPAGLLSRTLGPRPRR
jgi:probable rRNA maturation factor